MGEEQEEEEEEAFLSFSSGFVGQNLRFFNGFKKKV